jgi:RNA polymerase sigma-70 factor, ECF subfamily
MHAPAQRFDVPTFEPTFVDSITNYIVVTCHRYRVRRVDIFDVVQTALTKIFASVGSFRPEKGTFDTWARGVARNVIRRHLRDTKRHGACFSEYHLDVDDYATHAPSPERCVQRKQAQCLISNAMKSLTAEQASVVVLFDIDELSHKEIGNDLDISEGASHMCHKRAHKRLARCLDRDLLSVMPPGLTGCDEPASFDEFVSSNETGSRWHEWSHYKGQIVATMLALLPFVPSCMEHQVHSLTKGDARVLGHVENVAMYRSDKHVDVQDEPAVLRDAPSVKPAPASLPSVRTVFAPTMSPDKRTYVQDLAPLPPYKHTPDARDHLLPDR